MTKKHFMKALGISAVAIFTLAGVPAEAANFYVRNCTDQRILVCSYAEHNEKMWVAATARNVEPGERRKFRCHGREKKGKHCKAFVAITAKGGKFRVGKYVSEALHASTVAGAGVKAAKYAKSANTPEAIEGGAEVEGALPAAAETAGTAAAEGEVAGSAAAAEGGLAEAAVAASSYAVAAVGVGIAAYAIARGLHKNNLCRKIRLGTLKTDKKHGKHLVRSIEHPPTITDRYNHFDVDVSRKRPVLTLASGDQCR